MFIHLLKKKKLFEGAYSFLSITPDAIDILAKKYSVCI